MEPLEEVVCEIEDEFSGPIIDALSLRRGEVCIQFFALARLADCPKLCSCQQLHADVHPGFLLLIMFLLFASKIQLCSNAEAALLIVRAYCLAYSMSRSTSGPSSSAVTACLSIHRNSALTEFNTLPKIVIPCSLQHLTYHLLQHPTVIWSSAILVCTLFCMHLQTCISHVDTHMGCPPGRVKPR